MQRATCNIRLDTIYLHLVNLPSASEVAN